MDKLDKSIAIRKAHYVGNSVVLTIDPIHVKRLGIDDFTYFLQRPVDNGILLEKRRLTTAGDQTENQSEENQSTRS